MSDSESVVQSLVAKLDGFAAGLSEPERELLGEMLWGGDDEVSGFNLFDPWPSKAVDPDPRVAYLNSVVKPTGFTAPGDVAGVITKSGGGNDI